MVLPDLAGTLANGDMLVSEMPQPLPTTFTNRAVGGGTAPAVWEQDGLCGVGRDVE